MKLFTSESVTAGHPDKLCDQISDNILDAYLKVDKNARVACEVCVNKECIVVMGEVSSRKKIDIEKIVRNTVINIGYDNDDLKFNGNNIKIEIYLSEQSKDIACGVDKALDNETASGAGDQGMMFGYATKETKEYLPYPIYMANKLALELTNLFRSKILTYLRPDGKVQITVAYEKDLPIYIDTIIISVQHDDISLNKLKKDIQKYIIDKFIPKNMINNNTKIYINPTGRFIMGGPAADSGLTGRKIIADTYGGYCAHGGGAFSGKDPSKVDRSAAYYARYVAKNLVAAGVCDKIEIQVSYAIGISKPISLYINTYNTNKISEDKIEDIINKVFNFEPSNMVKQLNLKRPIYHLTTCFGHFGKKELPWEMLDKVEIIKKLV